MKLDEYRIELYPSGEWGAVLGPDDRVRVHASLSGAMWAIGKGLPKDYPSAMMVRIEIYAGEEWPAYEGKP